MDEYYSDKITEEELIKLENKIRKEYSKASREMALTASEYFDKLEERYNKEFEAYKQGKYTEEEFKAWYRTQVLRGEGYQRMRDELANKATQADMIASAYINDTTPSIYSLNRDFEAYVIEGVTGIDWHMADAQTMRNLFTEEREVVEFRTTNVKPIRDYEWNKSEIQKALISGIAQGKNLKKLKDSYLSVMKRDKASAVRNARTSFTSAQNAGRQATYERAEAMGIKIQKQWMATLDSRTRDSHQKLDGEVVPYKETFSNGLEYPADPKGEPKEVYNCRCTMTAVLPDYGKDNLKRIGRDEKGRNTYFNNTTYKGNNGTESYEDWLKDDRKILKMNLQYFASSDYDTIILDKSEYAMVISELNTNMTQAQRKKKVINKAIGDYIYTVENNGFNNYRIIGRESIE